MASSSVAGLPSMVATGRSSTWWLRNHALPRTQAFLALVMWLFSTVNSISSQTQPQKVQVALLTTFNSAMGYSLLGSFLRGWSDVQIAADLPDQPELDLAMPR